MQKSLRVSRVVGRGLGALSIVAALATFVTTPASAHFALEQPVANQSYDSLGSPQKLGPCGDEGGATATNAVTAYVKGSTISITIDEKIFHPGHYRVSLAVNDPSELPPEPVVTPGAQACGSVPVMSPPVYPVLADGMLEHTTPFSEPQTFQVTLPADVTCEHCTLQVIEFMSDHGLNNPGGCFYHHCANIALGDVASTAAATTSVTSVATGNPNPAGPSATSSGSGGGAGGAPGSSSSSTGCSCSAADTSTAPRDGLSAFFVLALGLLGRRGRRVVKG